MKGRSNGNISLMAPLRRDAVSRGHRSRERAVQTLKLQSVPQTDQAGPAFKVLLKAQLLSRFAPTGPFNPATWDSIPSLSRCSFLFFVLFFFFLLHPSSSNLVHNCLLRLLCSTQAAAQTPRYQGPGWLYLIIVCLSC